MTEPTSRSADADRTTGQPWYKRWWAIALVAFGGLIVLFAAIPTPEPAPTPEPTRSAPEDPIDDSTVVCAAPPYRPTHLPWLEGGGGVGDPDAERGGTRQSPGVVLSWVEDSEAFAAADPAYDGGLVTVSTNFQPGRELRAEEYPQVEVQGHPGELVWIGDPGIGGVSVTWREQPGHCGTYSVAFGMTKALLPHIDMETVEEEHGWRDPTEPLEAELLRVVESLASKNPG